jgi:hypothetical protein
MTIDAASFLIAADGIRGSAKVEDAADRLGAKVDMDFEGMAT